MGPSGKRCIMKRLSVLGAWLSLVERLVRDQEAGGSNPLAPTNPFSNFEAVDGQTAHPVPKLLLGVRAPILRPWQRTQPPTFPQHRTRPRNPLLLESIGQ